MRRAGLTLLALLCACFGGVVAGELLAPFARSLAGKVGNRGEFVATVRGNSYYTGDLEDPRALTTIVAERLRRSGQSAVVAATEVDREVALLQAQFGDPEAFQVALRNTGSDQLSLRLGITDHLEVRHWLEGQVGPQLGASEAECRQVHNTAAADFVQPKRYRASHLFIAAPEGTKPDVLAAKRSTAEGLGVRVIAGEPFADLAAKASEDEETKLRGGDLGYFSAARAPAEFVAELEKLAVGQTSAPFRSHLGFHIVQLTELKPGNRLTFEQARPEIAAEIVNKKRAAAVAQLVASIRKSDLPSPVAQRQ